MAVETSIQIRESCYRCQKILAQEGESLRDIDGRIAETVTKLMQCGRCHIAKYCTPDCQKVHWPEHKMNCIENHTAFWGMDKAILINTIRQLFKKTVLTTDPGARKDRLGMGYGRMFLELDGDLNFIVEEGRYRVIEGKMFVLPKVGLRSELDVMKKKNPNPNGIIKSEIAYLEQRIRLSTIHTDRFIVSVNTRGTEEVGNFMFRICQ